MTCLLACAFMRRGLGEAQSLGLIQASEVIRFDHAVRWRHLVLGPGTTCLGDFQNLGSDAMRRTSPGAAI